MKPLYTHTRYTLLIVLLSAVLSLSFLSGCSSTGAFIATNLTNVELGRTNYKIVATNVSGEAEAGYLLGFTWNTGVTNTTFALARVDGSEALYRDAIHNLWLSYETKNGSAEGKKLALINIRYDSDNLNLFLYAKAHISVRADVVEFID
ncbi:MAG TPA: DUF6567 family protein [Balneolales bacterium]|nr:DUF6567 family protein [Balneolales bacterium]